MDRYLGDLWNKLPATIGRGLRSGVNLMVRDVITNRLTDDNPPYLNRDTGNLIRSVSASPSFSVQGDLNSETAIFTGQFGSNLSYAKKHEDGGTFTEYVPAHYRKRVGKARRNARARSRAGLISKQLGDKVFVRAHTRTITYRARHMFRDTVKAQHFGAARRMRRSLELLHKNRNVPSLAEIAGGG